MPRDDAPQVLTPRWTVMRPHAVQLAYLHSPHRFNTVPAGRRSGKTERAKRKLIRRALSFRGDWTPRFFAAAPTRDQAKRIYWNDLKDLSPRHLIKDVSDSELRIQYVTDAEIWVLGMDKPERIEGQPWDGGVLDEYANMKAQAFPENVRPALSDRRGWCDLIGVPEGRNHYYDVDKRAKADMLELGAKSDWGSYHWKSADILPPEEIEAARRDLDQLTFEQEYEASFINFSGRAYYPFNEHDHCKKLAYDPRKPLVFCFDFNVEPGVAAVIQEQTLPNGLSGTGVVGEVYIERNSNTPAVCAKLAQDWSTHPSRVSCYGDATGGARGSAKVEGSDWALVERELRQHFHARLDMRVKKANPPERTRINSVNTRLLNGAKQVHLMVDPSRAPHVVRDFEGVSLLEGGSGELDKSKDRKLTHVSDAIGYYVEYEFPIVEPARATMRSMFG